MADGPGNTGSHIAYCVLHGVCRVQNIADEEEREIRRLVLKAIAAAAPHRAAARLSAMLHSNAAPRHFHAPALRELAMPGR